jgi:hypothetical protein
MASAIIPVLGGLGSLFGSIFGAKKQNQQANQQYQDTRRQIADYEGKYGDWQKMLAGYFQGGPGQAGLFGPQQSTSTTTGTSSSNESFRNNPFVTGEYLPLAGMLRKTYEDRLTRGSSLPAGYAASQAREINASYAPQAAQEANALARRGVSASSTFGSPAANARRGAQLDLAAKLPMLARDLQNQDLQAAQSLTAEFGKGQEGTRRSTSTQSSTGTQISPANLAAIMQYFGMLAPPTPTIIGQPQQQNTLGGIPAALQTALSLSSLFKGGQQANA